MRGRRSERIGIVSLLIAPNGAEVCSHGLQPVVWVAFGMMRPDWARVTRISLEQAAPAPIQGATVFDREIRGLKPPGYMPTSLWDGIQIASPVSALGSS